MCKQFSTLFLLLFIILSCSKKEQTVKVNTKKPAMSIVVKHTGYKKLDAFSNEKIKNWKEYNTMTEFLDRFKNTSPNDALSNALELKKITKNLKDSIRINELKIPSFKARINVLENETLRLADMTYIPAITAKEVNSQVAKVFLIFNSLNAKIKTFYSQERFNKEINLDDFFKLDSTESKQNNTPTIKEEISTFKRE